VPIHDHSVDDGRDGQMVTFLQLLSHFSHLPSFTFLSFLTITFYNTLFFSVSARWSRATFSFAML
jgi:hypothetical protein